MLATFMALHSCGGANSNRWICISRLWDPWLAPAHGKTYFNLSRDGILCSFLSESGQTMVLLALNGTNDVQTVFRADDGGQVMVKVCSKVTKQRR
jgi:hypothetical protein